MNSPDDALLLLSRPIQEVEINLLDPIYVARVQYYLEHELGCSFTYMSERGGFYLVRFPPGTVEETYAGRSTQWTTVTTIRLPNGVTLSKHVRAPLNPSQSRRVSLAFPNAILDRPEKSRESDDAAGQRKARKN